MLVLQERHAAERHEAEGSRQPEQATNAGGAERHAKVGHEIYEAVLSVTMDTGRFRVV